jgi:TolB-like protein/Tfp pilus assembly protein PilF/predicted Ser/Thr protein kinase
VATATLTGTSILHYHIGPRLGSGGMGEVYVADDRRLGRQVALKFLPPDRRRDADSRARLFREAQAASLLQSPHIAVTYDLVEHEDSMFIAMEYVDGELISERVARGPLPVPEALDIAAQVAEALDEAHGRGVTHRDIKSANLIQTRRGLVKVLDFGLAKLDVPASVEANLLTQPDILVTAPGMVLGTIAYMAPEQLRGDAVDQRVDLWALGVVLYEMLAGKLPFRGNTLAVVFDQILRQEPAPLAQLNPAIPLDVEHVVRRALQKAPVSRYNAARDMHNALRHAARRLETGGRTTGVQPVHVETGERTIAVLTFTNVTGDAADDWIGTGIAETVTADLKNVRDVTVIGRAQVFEQFKNANAETGRNSDSLAIEIGRRLGAWWVVSGAYQRIGERIRITAQLVEVLNGTLLRTLKIDGRVSDIFELQDRIVFDLSRSLNVKLGKAEADAIERDETTSVEAFEAYSRGVLNLRSAGRDAIDRAIALFERAVQLDPRYAAAWAALGGAYTLKGGFLGMPQLQDKAIVPLRRALELNPSLVSAHVWLGSALAAQGKLDEALASLRRAVEIEPDNADAHQTLARAYWLSKGMVPEGIAELRTSLALNPEAGYTHLQLSMLEALSGNLDAAEQSARQAIELQERAISGTEGLLIVGAHARLGYVQYLRGDYDAAYAEFRRELEYVATSDHALRERTLIELHQKLSAVHHARGENTEALRFGDLAIQAHARRVAAGADDPATRYYIAAVYARRRDVEHTKEHLALPLSRLPQFTRWRLARDIDFDRVRDQLGL